MEVQMAAGVTVSAVVYLVRMEYFVNSAGNGSNIGKELVSLFIR